MTSEQTELAQIDQKVRQKRHMYLKIAGICLVIVAVIIGLGVKHVSDQHKEMVKIVRKNEPKITNHLHLKDKNNFINKITFNESGTRRNPMGGVNFSGYVNGNKDLSFSGVISGESNNTYIGSLILESDLSDQLGGD